MSVARAVLLPVSLLLAGPALAACTLPEPLLQAVRSASRVQMEQLGPEDTRVDTPLAHVPGRTLGYEVVGVVRVPPAVADALERALGRRDSYACEPGAARSAFDTPGPLPIGVYFAARGGAAAVVLHLPEGVVEIQTEGAARATAPLSRAGQRRWEDALALLARSTRTGPDEFYRQMLPPVHVPTPADSPGPVPDTTRAPRDGAGSPR